MKCANCHHEERAHTGLGLSHCTVCLCPGFVPAAPIIIVEQPDGNDVLIPLQMSAEETCPACGGSRHAPIQAVLGGKAAGGGICAVCKGKGKVTVK